MVFERYDNLMPLGENRLAALARARMCGRARKCVGAYPLMPTALVTGKRHCEAVPCV